MKSIVTTTLSLLIALGMLALTGCKQQTGGSSQSTTGSQEPFTLAWSEYPSWSVFGVAHGAGLIHKDAGEKGSLEEKWGVDVVLKELDYDSCLTAYANSTTDAVCITNMDVLAPAAGRNSVAILPTSTSDGADACIVTGIDSVDALKGQESRGLEKSVSQYMFERCLEELGKNPAEFPFRQMDPGAAAQAMQNKQESINSIVVWNPFVMQTLRTRPDEAKVLFDSTQIPEEIIDMVVVGADALQREGGDAFAGCVVEAYYAVNTMLASAEEGDDTLVKLGEKFSNLGLDDMKIVVQQTKFYATPDAGLALFGKSEFQNTIMPRVVDFCASHGIIEAKPSIAFGEGAAQLRFDTTYMSKAAAAP